MVFNLFKRDNRKRTRDVPSGYIRTSQGSSRAEDDHSGRPRKKLQKLNMGGRKCESEVVPRTHAHALAGSSSDIEKQAKVGSSATTSELRGPNISDIVLDPYHYNTLLLQASAARDNQLDPHDEQPRTPSSDGLSGDVEAPPSTPLFHTHAQDNCNQDGRTSGYVTKRKSSSSSHASSEALGARSFDRTAEGVTYDAILASTLHKETLGPVSEEGASLAQPPETRVPPNSRPVTVLAGCGSIYTSLVGVSMAIMENRI